MISPPRTFTAICLLLSILAAAHAQSQRIVGAYGGSGTVVRETFADLGGNHIYPAITWSEPNDFMPNIVAAAHAKGMMVLPSLAMGMDRDHPLLRDHPEYFEKWRDGRDVHESWASQLSWAHDEVRAFKVKTVVDAVERWQVDGVLLDYTRFFTTRSGYCDAIVDGFKQHTGRDARAIDPDDEQWVRYRASFVTRFVRELRAALPNDKTIWVCANADPDECLRNNMQDWRTWLDEGLIAGVVSMVYHRDANHALEQIIRGNEAIAGRVPHVPMLAATDGFMTDADLLLDGVRKALASGADGVAFYHGAAVHNLGLWATVEQAIAAAHGDGVDAQSINYIRNGSFTHGDAWWAIGDGEGIDIADGQLTMRLGGPRAIRQLITEGWLPHYAAATIDVHHSSSDLSGDAAATLVLSVWDRKGRESYYRVPLDLQTQATSVTLPLVPRADFERVILSIEANGSEGALTLHDVSLRPAITAMQLPRHVARVDRSGNDTPADVNLLRGQPASSSSAWDANFTADNAVDGDLSSEDYGKGAAWHSQRPAVNQWLIVMLPQPRIMSRFRMLNSSAQAAYRTRQYRIEVSLDGKQYRAVAEGTLPDDGATWTEVTIDPALARFVRFVGVSGYNRDYTVGLKEIEAYR